MEIPADMRYSLKRMQFNRVSTRFSPLSSTSATLGDTVVARIPTNCLVDLSSLACFFTVATTSDTASSKLAGFGRGSHNLVRSLQVSVGGNVILNLNEYGHVFSALSLLSSSKAASDSKSILTFDQDISTTLPATANMSGVQMAILEFYGISNIQPSIISTALTGEILIHMQLASNFSEAGGLCGASSAVAGLN